MECGKKQLIYSVSHNHEVQHPAMKPSDSKALTVPHIIEKCDSGLLSPIPASQAPVVVKQYQDRAQRWIDDWLSLLSDKHKGLMASDITHYVPYREAIATSEGIESDRAIWEDFEPVAEWIEILLPVGTAD